MRTPVCVAMICSSGKQGAPPAFAFWYYLSSLYNVLHVVIWFLGKKYAINWQIWNSNMLFHWDGKNRRGVLKKKGKKRIHFFGTNKAVADEQKQHCCALRIKPMPTCNCAVLSVCPTRLMALAVEVEKGSATGRPRAHLCEPGTQLVTGPWHASRPLFPSGDLQPGAGFLPLGDGFALPSLVRIYSQGLVKLELLRKDECGRVRKLLVVLSFFFFPLLYFYYCCCY